MEDMNEVFNSSTESSVYIEGNEEPKKKFIPIEPGEYTGHITEYSSRIVEWTKDEESFKARVHNYKVELKVADEEFNGRIFRSSGIFQFLEPQKGDTFVSNKGGNKSYLRFCEDIGVECEEVEREVDGEKLKVKQLPNLTEKDVLGAPVIGVLNFGKSYKDKNGFTKKPMQVKFIKKWADGERLDIKTAKEIEDDIPF